jgi:anti-sigma B factor antagonist
VVHAVGRIPSPQQSAGRALVMTVTGEIDLATVDQVRAALAAGVDHLRDGDILVIDLTGVTLLSSTGLQALLDVTQAAQRRRAVVRIVIDCTGPVISQITVTGLDTVLALRDTVQDALRTPS